MLHNRRVTHHGEDILKLRKEDAILNRINRITIWIFFLIVLGHVKNPLFSPVKRTLGPCVYKADGEDCQENYHLYKYKCGYGLIS